MTANQSIRDRRLEAGGETAGETAAARSPDRRAGAAG